MLTSFCASVSSSVEPPGDADPRSRARPPSPLRDPLAGGGQGPELMARPSGRFMRGDLQGTSTDADEKPPADVTLSRPFAIGVYEVTFDEFDAFCDATGRVKPDDSGWGRDRRPVVNVTWNDAVAYTRWLSGQTGWLYRLPTDAEWEYAARAGTSTRFWRGDDIGVDLANCAGCGSAWDGYETAPVASFQPNPFGLYDTAGNVFEWVADCFAETFANASADGSAYENPAGCGQRVYRGGSWSFPPREARS